MYWNYIKTINDAFKRLHSFGSYNNFSCFSKSYLLDYLLQTEQYWIGKYVRTLRKEEFYTFYRKNKFLRYYYFRKKNILGRKLGFFIGAGCFDAG